jgi:glycine/D-amino acid oxidase-like deaminating enzyme
MSPGGRRRLVVVGGGILGTLHALEGVRRGYEVVHLERDLAPRGASVRNFGLVWVSGRAAGDELALALEARERWASIGAAVPGAGFRPSGSLTVARTKAELAVLEAAADAPDAADRGLSLCTPGEVAALAPALRGEIAGALRCRLDATVEPRRVLGAADPGGGAVAVDGQMVDRPVLERARALLAASGHPPETGAGDEGSGRA